MGMRIGQTRYQAYLILMRIDVQDAQTKLSRCLQRVERGETIVICRRNVPVAELRPVTPARRKPRPVGLERGRITVPPAFFEPLPRELEDASARRFERGAHRAT